MFLIAYCENQNVLLFQDMRCGFRGYLLVCSCSLHSITEKCLEMGWNCQNTLGSGVPYRILRESKRFTLSRYEMWVSWVPTGLFVFSAFDNRKMSRNGLKLSKYVRKWCSLSHTARIKTFYSFKIWDVGFVGTYWFVRILCIRKPKNVSKWVAIFKIR